MGKKYSSQIANQLVAHMNENGYRHEFDREKGLIRANFKTDGKIGRVRFVFDILEWGFVSYGVIDMSVGEEQRKEVAEFITRANYGLQLGNFEMDFSDGEIRYKFAVDCDNCKVSSEVIEDSMNVCLSMYKRYGDSLLRVIFGMESAKEAVRVAEQGGASRKTCPHCGKGIEPGTIYCSNCGGKV